jgi:hypothetical protein
MQIGNGDGVGDFEGLSRRLDYLAGSRGRRRAGRQDAGGESRADDSGVHHLQLEGYGYRWLRAGASDNTLDRQAR